MDTQYLMTGAAIGYQTYHVGQAGLSALGSVSPRVYAAARKIHGVVMASEALATLGSTIASVVLAEYRFGLVASLCPKDPFWGDIYGRAVVIAAVGTAFVAAIAAAVIAVWVRSALAQPDRAQELQNAVAPDYRDRLRFKMAVSTEQAIREAMHVAQVVANLGLAALTGHVAYFATAAALQGYLLYNSCREEWVKLDVTYWVRFPELPAIEKITFHYFQRLFAVSAGQEDDCAICLEGPGNTALCANHSFHAECILPTLQEALDRIPLRHVQQTTRRENGSSSTHYTLKLAKAGLPNCPMCRQEPLGRAVEATVGIDPVYGFDLGPISASTVLA